MTGAGESSTEQAEYTYLTVPESDELRSCIGVVLAGLISRAGVGVGGLEEAVRVLEDAHAGGHTSYRFAVRQSGILSQVEQAPDSEAAGVNPDPEWRTLVELAS